MMKLEVRSARGLRRRDDKGDQREESSHDWDSYGTISGMIKRISFWGFAIGEPIGYSIVDESVLNRPSEEFSTAMDDGHPTIRRSVNIVNAHGLHMRPSTRFVNLATSYQSEIRVHFRESTANGKSILDMTMLAAEHGSTLEIEAQGTDAEAAIDALALLVAAGFHMGDE